MAKSTIVGLNSCCIPGSGDGTLRKNPTIWRSWNPALGAGLHRYKYLVTNGTTIKYCGLSFEVRLEKSLDFRGVLRERESRVTL